MTSAKSKGRRTRDPSAPPGNCSEGKKCTTTASGVQQRARADRGDTMNAPTMLEHALAYHRRGLSVVPAYPTQKRPVTKWGGLHNERMDEAELRKWFRNPHSLYRIGVVCGPASGNVCARDFDDMAA